MADRPRTAGGRGNAYAQDQLGQRTGGATDTNTCAPGATSAVGLTDTHISSAMAWATTEQLGTEAITALQTKLGSCPSGAYDRATVVAVYNQQRVWTPRGTIADSGKATRTVFQRLGLVFTNTITNATVADADVQGIERDYPEGVTVAIVPNFQRSVDGAAEFTSQARIFASNQGAIGLANGSVARGVPVVIRELGDAVEAVQSVHRGLLARSRAPAGRVPAWTRVKNLALFSHGESWGMGLNESNDFSGDGLHSTQRGNNPSNIQAFADALQGAVAGGVRVQLFACSSGADADRSSYEEWTGHTEGERHGEDSMAASMSGAFGRDASVYAHTTVGHTTENYAARVFGAESGGGQGGLHLFDSMYPASFVQSELSRLFPNHTDTQRTGRRDSLRELMWSHFKDSVTGEHSRTRKRYARPMGQEMFSNPEGARSMLHSDWTTWVAQSNRLAQVREAATR